MSRNLFAAQLRHKPATAIPDKRDELLADLAEQEANTPEHNGAAL